MATPTIEQAQAQYRVFNAAYFENALPTSTISFVKGLKVRGKPSWGATFKEEGVFHIQLDLGMPAALQKLTLLHEMIHVKLWPRSHKSKAWAAEVARLGSIGFLSEVL